MDFDEFLSLLPEPHQVSVEAYQGSGGTGDVYAAPVTVTGFVVEKRRLVRAPDGSQVVSESTVYAPPGTVAPPRSRVTLPSGDVTLVITAPLLDGAGLGLPDHREIACE